MHDRWKLISIPILGSALIYQIVPPSSDEPAPSHADGLPTSNVDLDAPPAVKLVATTTIWPRFTDYERASFQPFDQSRFQKTSESELALGETQNASTDGPAATTMTIEPSVQAIFQTTHGSVALINDRMFYTGDTLPDGSQVIEINSTGVVLTKP